MPQFQCIGHQSWAGSTFTLLTNYPELDLTPGAFPNNQGLYCREWDITNPRVNEIVFPMIDEIVDAFEADGVHLGMDEIFLIGSEESPSTRGKDPAKLFARAINEYHAHFVQEKGLEMFMWGDRLIDGKEHGYGSYESSFVGTAAAVDMIPKDIVICDWHYTPKPEYTSVTMFMDKGFRVLPSSWRRLDGVQALVKYSYGLEHPNMAGHLFTTWSRLDPDSLLAYAPMLTGIETIRSGHYYDVSFDLASFSSGGELEVTLSAPRDDLRIHYTVDGSTPTPDAPLYSGPIHVGQTTTIRAVSVRDGDVVADVTEKQFLVHKATGKPVTLTAEPSPKYPPRDGVAALVNGVNGSTSYGDEQWVGLEGPDLEAVIDLGETVQVSSVTVTSLSDRPNWVFPTTGVEVSGSTDGSDFAPLGRAAAPESGAAIVPVDVSFPPATVRYLKAVVRNRLIPAGHEGAGSPAWLFVDEIVVR